MRSLLRASIFVVAVFATANGLPAQVIRVLVVAGDATIQSPGDAAPRPLTKGEIVPLGATLATGAGGRVVLTPFPGIKSMLAENSSLLVERAGETADAGKVKLQQATLDLKTGALVTDLEKTPGVAYDYSVKTPRGVAGARGTIYAVAVDRSGVESVLVSDGSIQITLTDGAVITLAPGSASVTRPGAAPVAVARLSDLPAADQAILQDVMELTLQTLAAAIEDGVDLQADALELTLQFARDFGFALDPALLESLQAALAQEDADKFDAMLDRVDAVPTNTTNTDDSTVVADNDEARDGEGEETPPPPPPPPGDDFLNGLNATRRATFLSLPEDIQTQLRQLKDSDYTGVILDGDTARGVAFTPTEMRDALANLAYLKAHDPAAFAFLKQVSGGAGLPGIEGAPSPTEHSLDAFRRTAQTWSALTPAQRTTLTNLGAGGAVMDTSATYLTAVLADYAALSATERAAIGAAGWGAYLAQFVSDDTMTPALQQAAGLSAAQLATLKAFGISPAAFSYYSGGGQLAAASVGPRDYYGVDYAARLDALAGLSAADRAALRRLDLQDRLMAEIYGYYDENDDYVAADFSSRVERTLAFYAELTAGEKDLLVGLGAGSWLFEYGADDSVQSEGSETALDRVRDILGQVAELGVESPAALEAARTLRLFEGSDLQDHRIESGDFAEVLAAYLDAPSAVRRFVREEFGGAALLDTTLGGRYESSARPFSEIVAILSELSDGELSELRDMKIGDTLAQTYFFTADYQQQPTLELLQTAEAATPAAELKAMIAFYAGLGDTEKFAFVELGILSQAKDNFAAFLADFEGLGNLVRAYAAQDADIRNATRIPSYAYYQNFEGRSFFVPKAEVGDYGGTLYYVTFTSDADLHVGATRHLRIASGSISEYDTFTTGEGGTVYLRAGDLVELSDVRFANTVRSTIIEAATIALYNVDFRDGMTVALNSKYGGAGADGTGSGKYPVFEQGSVYGRVNFNNVRYGGNLLDNASAYDLYGQNIAIGTLQNKAAPPAYKPLPPPPSSAD